MTAAPDRRRRVHRRRRRAHRPRRRRAHAARPRRGRRRGRATLVETRARRGARRLVPVVVPQPAPRGAGRRRARRRVPRTSRGHVGCRAASRSIREFERTTFALLNAYTSGAFDGHRAAAERAGRRRACRCRCSWCTPAAARSPSTRRGGMPIGLAESGPAAGVGRGRRVAHATRTSTDARHLRHGRHVVRRVGRRAAVRPARRTRGDLMGVWTALSLVDVDSIGAGGGSIGWIDARGMLRVGPALGRRGARARVLRPRRHRGHRHRRARRARLPRPGPLPRRRHGARRRAAASAACARARHDARRCRPRTRRGASASSRSPAWSRPCADGSPRGLDPRGHALFSFGGCGGAVHRRHRARDRDGHRGRPRARVGALGVRRRDGRRAPRAARSARDGVPRRHRRGGGDRREAPRPGGCRPRRRRRRAGRPLRGVRGRSALQAPEVGAHRAPHRRALRRRGHRPADRRLPQPSTRGATARARSWPARPSSW